MVRGEERCRVALWRGYVSGQFYARPQEHDVALWVSPSFRTWRWPWRRRGRLEDNPAVLSALRALEAQLMGEGWQRMRRAPGSAWYELRFRQAAPHRYRAAVAPKARVHSRRREVVSPGDGFAGGRDPQTPERVPRLSGTSA